MRDYARKIPRRAKKGDDLFVTLFFVLLAPIAALAFLATPAFLGTRDSLARYAPADATTYAHGGGAGADRILSTLVDVPAGVRPREAAVFYERENDGALHRATLMAWDAVRRPTPSERQALADRGAIELGPRAFIIADDALVSSARGASADKTSLADDATVRRALATMRGIDTVQAYVVPETFRDRAADLLKGVPPLVAAAAPTEALTGAVMMPADVAASYFPFGFRAPPTEKRASRPVSGLGKTMISVASPDFDAVGLLFGTMDDASATAETARKTLSAAFAAPIQVSLFPDAATKTTSALLRFPTLAPASLATAIERYASSVWPERHAFVMPDQDQAVEYRLNADRYHFAPMPNAPIAGTMTLSMEQPALTVFLAPDGGGHGSWVTTDADLLAKSASPAKGAAAGRCAGPTSSQFIHMANPATLLAGNPELHQFMTLFEAENVAVSFFGDNILLFCGYAG